MVAGGRWVVAEGRWVVAGGSLEDHGQPPPLRAGAASEPVTETWATEEG